MPSTTNFNWTTPADTDLVKDGAAAIRTLGNGIDTSLVDLKGGTTGQVLSKASNTDLDYSWVTPNVGDITEVQAGTGISVASGTGPIPVVTSTVATTFDAKGDLVVGTGADTFAKLSVGTNGYTLIADSSETTGVKWGAAPSGLTFISRTAISGASSYNFTDVFTSTYEQYLVLLANLDVTGGTDQLRMRMRYGTTTDTGAGEYYQGGYYVTYTGTTATLSISGGSYFALNYQIGNSRGKNVIWFEGVGTGSSVRAVYNQEGFGGQNQEVVISSGSAGQTARNYTGFHLYSSGSNNFSGNVTIYGLAKA